MSDLSFEAVLRDECSANLESIAEARRPLAVGHRFVDVVVSVLKRFGAEGLSKLNRADVVAAVSKIYDDFISKIDLPGPFDPLIHSMLKSTVLAIIGQVFDAMSAPAS